MLGFFNVTGACFPRVIVADYLALALIDGALAALAFCQFIRIHSRNAQLGLTRQKVVHLMIGISNLGFCAYFTLTMIAACAGWPCWGSWCGFISMACPKILFLAAFLLILSFWVDLCHQADDEDDEEENSFREALLDNTNNKSTSVHQECCPIPSVHVGNRQKIVILVTVFVFVLMMVFAVLIWIGLGKNPIDSALVAQVYVDLSAVVIFLLGVALACYGILIYLKMSKVRSEGPSYEMWKVTGLAVVSTVCFTTSALVALLTNIPELYRWHQQRVNPVSATLLMFLYYFIGSSVPSAFVLWVMRELPPSVVAHKPDESRVVTFITNTSPGTHDSQHWTTIASSQNQTSRASPI